MRRMRRSTLRYQEEQARIEAWLDLVQDTAKRDVDAAIEVAKLPQLIKGYSDTFERGLGNFLRLIEEVEPALRTSGGAARIAALRSAALADDKGNAFRELLTAQG